jgi:NAD(P)-dependent dehydrogenase (short-subunit alcohol dehydrogenase family)
LKFHSPTNFAASGIGLAVVERLVKRGWNTAVVDKDQNTGEQVARRLGAQVVFLEVDVRDYDEQAQAFAKTWAKWNRLDLGRSSLWMDTRSR